MLIVATGASFLVAAVLLWLVPTLLTRPPRALLAALAVAAVAGAVVATAAPTGASVPDAVHRGVLGLVLVGAGALAGRIPVALAAAGATAAVVVGGSPVDALAGAALGLAALGLAAPGRTPLLGAAAGGLLAQVVLRLEGLAPTGASLLVGAAVTAVLVVPALAALPGRARRPLAGVVAAAALVAVVGVVGVGVAATRIVDDVEVAVADAERGLDLVADEPDDARAALASAAERFDAAGDRLAAPWVRPALVVPVLAQQVRAVSTMAEGGRDLAEVAATSLAEADVDAIRPVGGQFDLAAVRALQAPLARAEQALVGTGARLDGARSPWLAGPVAERLDELAERVDDASGSAEVAALAVDALPGMLGGDGARRYLLLVQQPAESRGSGGLPGNYGELVAEDGRLSLTSFGRHEELTEGGTPPEARTVDMSDTFDALYGYAPHLLGWQNVTFAPDFTVVAELVRQLYPQSGGQPIDGVIAIDPSAVADLLDLVGGVELSDGRTLDASNAETFLYHDQYVDFASEEDDAPYEGYSQRVDLLGEAAARTWVRLLEGDLPGPRALARAFGPAVDGRHLQMAAFDPAAQRLLERVGMAGTLPEPTGDGVGVVLQNVGENKIDWFLDRSTAYDARWDPGTGAVEGTYRVTLTNRAPAEGLPRYVIGPYLFGEDGYTTVAGDNAALVYLYTALPPTAVRADGLEAEGDVQRDGRWYVTPLRVKVPAGATAVVEVDVAGTLEGERWHLDVVRQPTIHGEALEVSLAATDGWELTGAAAMRRDGPGRLGASLALDEPVSLAAGAEAVAAGGDVAAEGG